MITTLVVQCSDAFDMVGPYLAAKATCPFCGRTNILAHIETYASVVKAVVICSHIRAIQWPEEGSAQNRVIEFTGESAAA